MKPHTLLQLLTLSVLLLAFGRRGPRDHRILPYDNRRVDVQKSGKPLVPLSTIMQIQGAAHHSPFSGKRVITAGIVTAVEARGFYLQDRTGDADVTTSDSIFVYTATSPGVVPGNAVRVEGTVQEFMPAYGPPAALTTTEIIRPRLTMLSSQNPLPAPVVLGQGGRMPPTQNIENDHLQRFEPHQDGLDFYESLEDMRVRVQDAVVVGPLTRSGALVVLANRGARATGLNARGSITIRQEDFNPERIFVHWPSRQQSASAFQGLTESPGLMNVGDVLGPLTGVLRYRSGHFEVLLTAKVRRRHLSTLQRQTTSLPGMPGQLTIATCNVNNLDPFDTPTKFQRLGAMIATHLRSPDIVGVQEIQDNSGPMDNGMVDASLTYIMLIRAIQQAGGVTYAFRDVAPEDNQDGGEAGGNIRVGFLFNPKRVRFVDRRATSATTASTIRRGRDGPELTYSPGRLAPSHRAFLGSRKPLVGEFIFAGQRLFVINVHFVSKRGSTPLFGSVQPPLNGGVVQRLAQARVVHHFVKSIVTLDPQARVVALGDFNEFAFASPLQDLVGHPHPLLSNLTQTLPATERYTYIFQGNAQALDHILVSASLTPVAEYDIVHVNTEFAEQASDHDPAVVRLRLRP